MKIPPQRIALVALVVVVVVVVVLMVGGLWWWRGTPNLAGSPPATLRPTADKPGETAAPVPGAMASLASIGAAIATCQRAIGAAFNERALQFRKNQDAPSQVAYALAVPLDPSLDLERMSPDEHQRRIVAWQNEIRGAFLRAAALAPDDPDILWLAATRCDSGNECHSVQRALLAAEPDNMAVWLREMEWAKRRGDAVASRAAMQRAAAAPMYDTHPGATQEVMMQAYAGMPTPAVCRSPEVRAADAQVRRLAGMPDHAVEATMLDHALGRGILNANMGGPAFSDLRQQCMPTENTMDREQRANCSAIMGRLADGDTMMERIIGLDVMVQLSAESPDGAGWRERYRQTRWLFQQQLDPRIQSLYRVEDFADGEIQTMQAALEAAGRWPPPADWLPDDEHARSLIQTGHPPPPKKRRSR